MSKRSDVRFLTIEDAEAFYLGNNPCHPIYPGDPRYEDANYEIGIRYFPEGFKLPVPQPYLGEIEWQKSNMKVGETKQYDGYSITKISEPIKDGQTK